MEDDGSMLIEKFRLGLECPSSQVDMDT